MNVEVQPTFPLGFLHVSISTYYTIENDRYHYPFPSWLTATISLPSGYSAGFFAYHCLSKYMSMIVGLFKEDLGGWKVWD